MFAACSYTGGTELLVAAGMATPNRIAPVAKEAYGS
jgi:hypothetical protein